MSEQTQMTNHDVIMAKAKELIPMLESEGYSDLRILDDGTIVGTSELAYTRAVYIGLNNVSWERRFCFSDRELATEECVKLKTSDDEPVGYIATRDNRH